MADFVFNGLPLCLFTTHATTVWDFLITSSNRLSPLKVYPGALHNGYHCYYRCWWRQITRSDRRNSWWLFFVFYSLAWHSKIVFMEHCMLIRLRNLPSSPDARREAPQGLWRSLRSCLTVSYSVRTVSVPRLHCAKHSAQCVYHITIYVLCTRKLYILPGCTNFLPVSVSFLLRGRWDDRPMSFLVLRFLCLSEYVLVTRKRASEENENESNVIYL